MLNSRTGKKKPPARRSSDFVKNIEANLRYAVAYLICAAFILCFTVILAGEASAAQTLPDTLKNQIQEQLVKMGVADVKVDINVEIPVTAAQNPVGGAESLWATAIYHTSPDSETGSIKRPTMVLVTAYRREIMGIMRLLVTTW
jgi:hypothetical protein